MPSSPEDIRSRRGFLRFLAASPLLASGGFIYGPLGRLLAAPRLVTGRALGVLAQVAEGADLISSPDQALDVMDFEPLARKRLPTAHWGYMATGVDDDATIRINHEGYSHFQIRSRRLVDVSKLDTSVHLLGTAWETPIVICPVGSQRAFHPEGELATARAARAKNHLQILSNVTTVSVEEVIAARGAPVWFQLYTNNDWDVVRGLVKRAEKAGCPALVMTVDLQDGSNRETLFRAERADTRECTNCHATTKGLAFSLENRPMFNGLDISKMNSLYFPGNTWDQVKRLRDATSMKLVVKGIVTKEDAQIAVQNGVQGILVSNHGGRGEDTLRPTIECLPEVLDGVAGKIPVLVDGGVRRGTDIFKAMALGAASTGIGRPYIWGLASFGQMGVEAVLAILRRELQTIMRQAGTPVLAKLTRASIVDRSH